MNALSIYFAIAAVLLGTLFIDGKADDSIEDNPLEEPMKIMAHNFNNSCHHLNQSDPLLKLIQYEGSLLGKLSADGLMAIIQSPEEDQRKSLGEILHFAIDNCYPEPDMANELFKKYFDDIFKNTGIPTMLLVSFGSQKGADKLFQSSMERACKNVPKSEKRCEILIPLIGCLEKSLAPQNVMNSYFPKRENTDPNSYK